MARPTLLSVLAASWARWVGMPDAFSMEQRLYHSTCLLLLPVLVILIGVNVQMALWPSAWISAAMLGVETLLYAWSRWGGNFRLSAAINGLLSYVALGLNYSLNAGMDGPTLYLFLLSFQVLMTVTPRSWQSVWIVCHSVVVIGLLLWEATHPEWKPAAYPSPTARLTDHLITYGITLLFLYILTRYLLRHYRQQRLLAENQATIIQEKNRELLRSEAQLQAFFQNAAHGHLLLDGSLRVLAFNREASLLFRRIRAYNLRAGCDALEALPATDASQLAELCQDALRGLRRDLELALPQSSGGLSWWRFSAGPARQADGSLLGVVLSAVSIQERVQHEAQLRAQGATLVQIANLHAHSLRGPAASILGLVKLVREQRYEATAEDLALLQEAAETLDARIHEIVTLTGERPATDTPAAKKA